MTTGSRIRRSLGAYLLAVAQNAVITILLFVVGFALAGLPWWALTGVACGILNLTPVVGSLLSLGLALLTAWGGFGSDWTRIAIVGGIWLAIQFVDGFILSPRAAGKAGVHPVLSIVLVFAAGMMFGPIGMLLAIPVTAVLLIVYRATRHA